MIGKYIKKTYTYSTLPSIKQKAAEKARKEGTTLSEVIHEFLDVYSKDGAFSKETVYFNQVGQMLLKESNKKKK